MPIPQLNIGFNIQKLKQQAAQASQLVQNAFSKAIPGASSAGGGSASNTNVASAFAKAMGLDPNNGTLKKSFEKSLDGFAKSAKVRAVSEDIAKKMAGDLSKQYGYKFDPDLLATQLRKAYDQAEQGGSQRSLADKMIWGKEGRERTVQGITKTMQNLSGTTMAGVTGGRLHSPNILSNMKSYGALGGVAAIGGELGSSLLGQTIAFGREDEAEKLRTVPFTGGFGASGERNYNRLQSKGWNKYKLTSGESAAIMRQTGQAGALGGTEAVMRAQSTFGMGGEMGGLLAAQAMRGGSITQKGSNTELSKIIATGMATGLDRGRWGELARGLAHMTESRGLGMRLDTGAVSSGLRAVSGQFKGREGFEAIGGLERLMTSPSSALGRAAALTSSGLGGKFGGDIFAAERQGEKGFFGEGGTGRAGINDVLGKYKKAYGFGALENVGNERQAGSAEETRRGAMIKELSGNMGMSQSSTEKLIKALEENKGGDDLKKIMEQGKPLEEQAYKAMISMSQFKGLEVEFEKAFKTFFTAIAPLIEVIIEDIEKGLGFLAKIVPKAAADAREGMDIISKSPLKAAGSPFAAAGAYWDQFKQSGKDIESIDKGYANVDTGKLKHDKQLVALINQLRGSDASEKDEGARAGKRANIEAKIAFEDLQKFAAEIRGAMSSVNINVKQSPEAHAAGIVAHAESVTGNPVGGG